MRGYVKTVQGVVFALPVATQWEFQYTAGIPCDSFLYCCPWDAGGDTGVVDWQEFYALEGEETVFYGVVDECETSISEKGALLEVSGRGMAALLLDNEALGQDYATATLDDILRNHVTPYGIQVAERKQLSPVSRFSVSVGSSEWSVLYDFCRYYNGVMPRFNQQGQLVLSGWKDDTVVKVDDGVAVMELVCLDRRYGILSEILVRDKVRQVVETLGNQEFLRSGGRCRRVLTMPGRSDYQTMRFSGQFQLNKSNGDLLRLELEVAQTFFARPGDLVQLQRTGWGRNGIYRAVEVQAGEDIRGGWSRLKLAAADIVM